MLIFFDRMDVDPSFAFLAVACLCEVHRYALSIFNWFSYEHMIGKLSRVIVLAAMVCILADNT